MFLTVLPTLHGPPTVCVTTLMYDCSVCVLFHLGIFFITCKQKFSANSCDPPFTSEHLKFVTLSVFDLSEQGGFHSGRT